MPLVYERAYGGPGHVENPLGVGILRSSGGRRSLPNVLHPDPPPATPVNPPGLAPISVLWPARRRLLGQTPQKVLEQPIAAIPDDLDDVYFQAAPADQRIDYLDGDEWIVLEGLHPAWPNLRMGLPSARGVARVYRPDGSSPALALWADTLLLDGDTERCSVTWRGSFPVPSEAALSAFAVAAGVETMGRPLEWPPRPEPDEEAVELSLRSPEVLEVSAAGTGRTIVLVEGESQAMPVAVLHDAARTQQLTGDAPPSSGRWSDTVPATPPSTPERPPPPPAGGAAPVSAPPSELERTLDLGAAAGGREPGGASRGA
jgi:hypothetical protein